MLTTLTTYLDSSGGNWFDSVLSGDSCRQYRLSNVKGRNKIMSNNEWQNDEKIDARTKIALKVLFVMFKVLSPYRFGSQFEKDIEAIKKELDAL